MQFPLRNGGDSVSLGGMKRFFLASMVLNVLLLFASGALFLRSPDHESGLVLAVREAPAGDRGSLRSEPNNDHAADAADAAVPPDAEEERPGPAVDPMAAIDGIAGLDQKAQVEALVAAGWEPEAAKVFILGRTLAEFVEIGVRRAASENEEYWRNPSRSLGMDWEEQREMLEMQQKMQAAMEDLLGGEGRTLFGGLPVPISDEKRHAAELLEMDYMLMSQKLQSDTGGILLPEDREALALLEEAKRRDLEALLTPDELLEYDLRMSDTARSLRHQLSGMEATEEEFRAIFQVQREMDLRLAALDPADSETQKLRMQASEERDHALKERLGEERFRQYKRSQDWGYSRLIAVTERLDLPRERVDEVYDLKEYAEHEQQALRTSDLSEEERNAALRTLNEETRADLADLLGEEGLELYRNNGGHWVNQLR